MAKLEPQSKPIELNLPQAEMVSIYDKMLQDFNE